MESVDVLIVGAGASASAFAWSLAETGMHIVCLEQGGWVDHQSFPSTTTEWEMRRDFSSDPNYRASAADYPINCDDSDIAAANFNGVGGGTVLYAGHFPRFHPSDFKVRSLDGVGADWPIDYGTLEPFYAVNDSMMGVSGLAGDPAYPPKQPMMPPLPLGRSGTVLAKGFNALGWHWWPSDCAINTEVYDGRERCINLGTCGSGCAQGAKGSVDVTYWPHAIRAGVEVRTKCRVERVALGSDGLARGVRYFDADGVARQVEASLVVLAANGIGTPRLLLNSACERFPTGLANSSGLVGKNLMFHPYAVVDAVFPEQLDGGAGPHKGISCQEFYESDPTRGFRRGFTFEMHRGYGPVSTAALGLATGRLPFGSGHHDAYRSLANRVVSLIAVCEDLPEATNEVVLDPNRSDAHGIPAAKVNYRVGENSAAMVDFALDRAEEALSAAGASEIIRKHGPVRSTGWHNMGTARMGLDPSTSVVNEWGRAHDVKNLLIIDGSIFVTSAGVNPTPTIQALALYIADQVKRRLYDATILD